jgi:uncharacterized protein (DUF1697 family)
MENQPCQKQLHHERIGADQISGNLLQNKAHASMMRYISFLRAINVGGHTVKMDRLRQLFESFGFNHVETFIASGNVIFETNLGDSRQLVEQIQAGLRQALGYDVAAFIRTPNELTRIVEYLPFPQAAIKKASAFNIAFLADPLTPASTEKLMTLRTPIDEFHVHGRETYWLCQKRQSESTFSNAVLERTLGIRSTLRGVNTVKLIAEKYISSGSEV